MCNRYKLKTKPDELLDLFSLSPSLRVPDIDKEFYPGRPAPVIFQDGDLRRLQGMTWGFPPFKGKRPINNTRSETAVSSPFWSRHLNNRCIFPMTAAVEWQHRVDPQTGELLKVPHTIGFRDGHIAAVAGIYKIEGDKAFCSMMTCRGNRLCSSIHNADPDDPRMVCFLLDSRDIVPWLDPNSPFEAVQRLLRPLLDEPELLTAHQTV